MAKALARVLAGAFAKDLARTLAQALPIALAKDLANWPRPYKQTL